jgi:cell division protein ZapA
MENKVVVKIYGEDYPITGSNDPAYISKIADFVDLRMRDIAANSRVKSRDKVAILTAMSIASELHEKNEALTQTRSSSDDRIERLIAKLENALSSPPQVSG